nr:RNA-directed DNA polymerase, eukaryota [Tanacetum cinerariifolium]
MYSCIIMHDMILEDQEFAINEFTEMFGHPRRNMQRMWIVKCEVQRRKANELRDKETHLNLQRNLMEHIWQDHQDEEEEFKLLERMFFSYFSKFSYDFKFSYGFLDEFEPGKAPQSGSSVKSRGTLAYLANRGVTEQDLWKVCNDYGTVVDVFIPNKKCKAGKRFAFVRFIKELLSYKGFHNTRIVYLGGLWVMIELKSSKNKLKFMQHVGVASWFRRLCNAQSDFAAKERNVWVDIEGKVFWAQAKELFVWSPSFKEVPEKVMCSDEESVKINDEANSLNNGVEESDSVVVSDTYFGDNGEDQGLKHQHGESSNAKEVSSDPFNIYGLLDKRTKEVRTTGTTTNIPYPPGFTHVNKNLASIKQDAPEVKSDRPPNRSERSNLRVLEEVANYVERSSSESINNGIKLMEGGSILEILEEMITMGQTMGFCMEGCTKDMEKIIGTQGEQVVFR